MPDKMTSLPLDLWFERVEVIASGALGSIENSLRHAGHLLQLLPEPLSGCVTWRIDECVMERLLDAQNFDDAAKYLLGDARGVCVVSEAGNSYRANLTCAKAEQDAVGLGASEAAAILAASTACLLQIRSTLCEPYHRAPQPPTRH